MSDLKGKRIFITGGSRGIGLAIVKRAARDGARVAIAAKTVEPHPKLPGTIHTAAAEIEAEGGQALPIVCDARDEGQLQAAVEQAAEAFGGLDICINNCSAIQLTGTLETDMKRYDLMHDVGPRATYAASKFCLPYLLKGENPHILTLAPPIDMARHWFGKWVAYTTAKYGMSLITLGLSQEFAGRVAVNALWPRTIIATAAVRNLGGGEAVLKGSRTPEIMADAAHAILTRKAADYTGRFLIDEAVLRENGVSDFERYASAPGEKLQIDLFVDE